MYFIISWCSIAIFYKNTLCYVINCLLRLYTVLCIFLVLWSCIYFFTAFQNFVQNYNKMYWRKNIHLLIIAKQKFIEQAQDFQTFYSILFITRTINKYIFLDTHFFPSLCIGILLNYRKNDLNFLRDWKVGWITKKKYTKYTKKLTHFSTW